jgi:hypothetical protein
MDCRTFHQKLEDYLQDGMDFSGRFGMERHAQQCISCGKEMADAQQLKRMASDLHRVKAPANFESSVLREIAKRKAHGRFWSIRKYWIYGFEWPSWWKAAFASTALAILALGLFYTSNRATLNQASAPPRVAGEPAKVAIEVKEAKANPGTNVDALSPISKKLITAETPKIAKKTQPSRNRIEQERRMDQNTPDMDYVEYILKDTMGPDNNAVPVRLPKRIPMRYSQMSEEYFIRNVSH